MLKLYINYLDVSTYVDEGSLSITDQIQNKADTCRFSLRPGVTKPTENQDLKIWDTVKLVSASGTSVIVEDVLGSGFSILDYGKFRAGQHFWLDIGGADEERVTIATIAAGSTGQVNITTTKTIQNSHSADEDCGRLIFGGTLTYIKQGNPKQLADVEYECTATDYTKIFDKKNINDSWENADSRYIINDFANTTINYNKELDDMDYADSAAVQAEWIESGDAGNPTVDTSDRIQGTSCVVFSFTI